MRLTLTKKPVVAAIAFAVAAGVLVFRNLPDSATVSARPSEASGAHRPPSRLAPRTAETPALPVFSADTGVGSSTLLPALEELASNSPKKALASLDRIEDPELRALALAAVASGWAGFDADAAAKWVDGLANETDQTHAREGLISVWANVAPDECLRWINRVETSGDHGDSILKLAETWASNNPREALEGFRVLESNEAIQRGLHAIVTRWAAEDPAAAVECVTSLENSPRHDELLQAALVSLSSRDPELAWQYADRFADGTHPDLARSKALETLAQTNPDEALQLAQSRGNSEEFLAAITRGWSITDDQAADQWLDSLPDADLARRLRAAATK